MFWKSRASFSFMIVGLGNPGKQYESSLHNSGFRVIDKVAGINAGSRARKRSSYLYTETDCSSKKIVLIKPHTYMNLSGKAVYEAMRWYRLLPENLMVIYDDLDLDPGIIRLKARGGSGGHKGLASVISYLGTDEFSRLRIGVGKPADKEATKDYVLGNPGAETGLISGAEERAAEAIIYTINNGLEPAMNKYNIVLH